MERRGEVKTEKKDELSVTDLEILNKSFLILVIVATVSTGFALLSSLFCKVVCSFVQDSVFHTVREREMRMGKR